MAYCALQNCVFCVVALQHYCVDYTCSLCIVHVDRAMRSSSATAYRDSEFRNENFATMYVVSDLISFQTNSLTKVIS